MQEPVFFPPAGDRILRFVGDIIECTLNVSEWTRPGWTAYLRTTIGRGAAINQYVLEAPFRKTPPRGTIWHDLPMTQDGQGRWTVQIPLVEVGFFYAKPFALDPQGRQHWPDGANAGVAVHPDKYRTANTIYCAFTRLFGPSRIAAKWRSNSQDPAIEALDRAGYTVIPPSGTLRDLKSQVPHIFETLGCKILHLLPVNPTPTTFARFGRYGSPYAVQDLVGVDPALVEFDKRRTGVEQFVELTDEVHAHGGRVFLDLVINHTGWGSTLYENHPEWFLRNADGSFASPGAWGTVWEDLVELKPEDPALWEEIARAFLTWCRRGVDGFRCDAGYKVPVPVWRYIVARVRAEFPDTLFLLEGLGGGWWDTEAILTEGGMQWAYSELFQEFSGRQVASYLDHALKQSQRVGLLVHYSETHDNNRLAARGRTWSLLRNRLSGLTSPNGAFGFTCGVEWLATEKIVVHQNSGLAWDQDENIIPELAQLNRLLADHPCFFDGATFERLSSDDSPALVLVRTSSDGLNQVLILVNTNPDQEQTALWAKARTPGQQQVQEFSTSWQDLLSQQPPSIVQTPGGLLEAVLPAGAVYCLSHQAVPTGPAGEQYRQARARSAWAYKQMLGLMPILQLPIVDWMKLSEMVFESPTAFLAACSLYASGRGPKSFEECYTRCSTEDYYHPVSEWTCRDASRILQVPAEHWLLAQSPELFNLILPGQEPESHLRMDSVPSRNGWVSAIAPSNRAGLQAMTMQFPGKPAANLDSTILFLEHLDPDRSLTGRIPAPDDLVLLTNGRGGMSRMRVNLGAVCSKYDCVLGANLHPDCPVDRHVFVKRIRVWSNADRFVTALDHDNLSQFVAGRTPVWKFLAPAGGDKLVAVELQAWMPQGNNSVNFLLRRPLDPATASIELSLTVRLDVEDRSFHSQTRRNGAAEYHFSSKTKPLEHGAGFLFSPAADRQILARASSGCFHPSPEWSENLQHPVEQNRWQEGSGDAYSPGWFELPLASGAQTLLQITSDLPFEAGFHNMEPEVARTAGNIREILIEATDAFIAKRGAGKTVIAGYPWFLDWGRDSLIAARGLIAAGRVQEVYDLVRVFAQFEQGGTLPNSIHGQDASNRETSDAPLWLGVVADELEAVGCTNSGGRSIYDSSVDANGRTLRQVLSSIAVNYSNGTIHGVRMDPGSALIWSPSHFTWMDTNYPAGTPREGYPIEIQALWIRLLNLLARVDEPSLRGRWSELSGRAQASLESLFWMEEPGWYADLLAAPAGCPAADALKDDALRSNAILAVSLDVLKGPRARLQLKATLRYLVVPGALRSLAPLTVKHTLPIWGANGRLLNDPANPYWGIYEGDEDTRRKPAYHNGTAWGWTFPSFCEAFLKVWPGDPLAHRAAGSHLSSILHLLNSGCIGHLPEIVDGNAPHRQKGCDAQAWSATEALRVLQILHPR